jgi:hypothetical protein
MGDKRNLHILVGRPKGKRPCGRPRYKWDDIEMDLKEVV